MTLVVLVALVATVARAEMALLANGRVLKVSAWQVHGDSIDLDLRSGGRVTLPIDEVERIVDDEIVPASEVEKKVGDSPLQRGTWRFDAGRRALFSSAYDRIIVAAAKKFDVDAALVSAVIKAESDYKPDAVSSKGARGLMQLMPFTARRFGVTNSFDAAENIHAGTRYLHALLDEFHSNAELALAAYNAGESTVKRYGGVPPWRETVDYLARISKYLETSDADDSTAGTQ